MIEPPSPSFTAGYHARLDGRSVDANPHPPETSAWLAWDDGWRAADLAEWGDGEVAADNLPPKENQT